MLQSKSNQSKSFRWQLNEYHEIVKVYETNLDTHIDVEFLRKSLGERNFAIWYAKQNLSQLQRHC